MPRPHPVLVLASAALLAVACGGTPSAVTTSTPPASVAALPSPSAALPTPVPTEGASSTPGRSLPAQTETAWGTIWDDLPDGFPVEAVGSAVEAAQDAPASGAFDSRVPVSDLAPALQAALEEGNFSTLSLSGPFEDGSMVIESVGPNSTECQVQTTAAPLGGLTRITVLYGAACPFPLE